MSFLDWFIPPVLSFNFQLHCSFLGTQIIWTSKAASRGFISVPTYWIYLDSSPMLMVLLSPLWRLASFYGRIPCSNFQLPNHGAIISYQSKLAFSKQFTQSVWRSNTILISITKFNSLLYSETLSYMYKIELIDFIDNKVVILRNWCLEGKLLWTYSKGVKE